MKPLHWYALAVTVIALVLGAWLYIERGNAGKLDEESIRLQMANDSLRRSMADRDGLILILSERDSLWRQRFIKLVAEDRSRIIYRLQHERFANTSGDSAVGFLLTKPDSLWSARYPGRTE